MKEQKNYIVYRKSVCEIKEIKKDELNKTEYYILIPQEDLSLRLTVPLKNNDFIREVISKEEVEKIIKKIPHIKPIECEERYMESEYKKLLNQGTHEDLIKIIKTTYLRNQARLDTKKKISEKDNYYFCLAEKYLYNEFSIALGISYEETKNYVINEVLALDN